MKWPNDIYFDGRQKIGGVLATTSIAGSNVTVAIGCGVNLDNERPTINLNRLIKDAGGSTLSLETLLAVTFNQLERLVVMVNVKSGLQEVLNLYHQHWLHRFLYNNILSIIF